MCIHCSYVKLVEGNTNGGSDAVHGDCGSGHGDDKCSGDGDSASISVKDIIIHACRNLCESEKGGGEIHLIVP